MFCTYRCTNVWNVKKYVDYSVIRPAIYSPLIPAAATFMSINYELYNGGVRRLRLVRCLITRVNFRAASIRRESARSQSLSA